MSIAALKYIGALISMKQEIKIISYVILTICLIPILFVLLLTQAGISIISEALVSGTPQTHDVNIHNPTTGQISDTVTGPFTWPVSGPVTLEFGEPDLPYQPLHTGIDIASPNHKVGDPVVAFMAGTVTYSDSISWGYGTHVKIDNGNHITSVYAHLNSLDVVVGQQVQAGKVIGTRGTTGWSTGPHTHFEIRVFGIPVNPRTFLEGNP